VVTVLGAGGVLAAVLSATGPAALAQPASAQAPSLPKACVAIEALVGDGASGSSIGAGEVLRVSPGGQSTLTTNTAPMGTPNLDDPTDMAYLSNGDIVVTDDSFTIGRPDVVEVNPSTGARTLTDQAHDAGIRENVAKELEAMGLSPATARERVAVLTQDEVSRIAGQTQNAPAGGEAVLTIFIIVLVAAMIYYSTRGAYQAR